MTNSCFSSNQLGRNDDPPDDDDVDDVDGSDVEFAGSEVDASVELLELVLVTDGVDDVVDDAIVDVILIVEGVGVVLSVVCVVVSEEVVSVVDIEVDFDVIVAVVVVAAAAVVVDDDREEEDDVAVEVSVLVDAEVGLAVEVVVVGFPNPRSQPAEKL